MMASTALPSLPVVVPLLGAAGLAAFREVLSRRIFDSCSIAIAALNLVFCVELLVHSWNHTIVYWFGNWYPRGTTVIGVGFVADPVAAGLAALAALLFQIGRASCRERV